MRKHLKCKVFSCRQGKLASVFKEVKNCSVRIGTLPKSTFLIGCRAEVENVGGAPVLLKEPAATRLRWTLDMVDCIVQLDEGLRRKGLQHLAKQNVSRKKINDKKAKLTNMYVNSSEAVTYGEFVGLSSEYLSSYVREQ